MKSFFALLPVFLFLCFFDAVQAQNQQNIEHTIQSEAFDTERRVRVHLPERYFNDTTTQFLVTYVLDAQYEPFWNMAHSNISYMVESYMVIPSVNEGLIRMSENYTCDQKIIEDFAANDSGDLREQARAFYQQQTATYGYTYEQKARYLRFVGDDFRDRGIFGPAVSVYQWALDKDATNLRVHISLADTYDQMGEKEAAGPAYQLVQTLLEEQKDEISESFYNTMLNWTKERLAELEE